MLSSSPAIPQRHLPSSFPAASPESPGLITMPIAAIKIAGALM